MPPSKQLEFDGVDPSGKRPKAAAKTPAYLLNAARVREYALALAERERFHHFTSVSVEFLQRIDAEVRNLIRAEIKRHPSRGKRLT